MRGWSSDVGETYLKNPIRQGNPVKTAMGIGMAGASLVLEAADYAIAGALNQKVEPPSGVPFGRVRRDIGALLTDVVTLHPIRAFLDLSRLAFSDLPLDTGEAVLGFDRDAHRMRSQTKQSIQQVVA